MWERVIQRGREGWNEKESVGGVDTDKEMEGDGDEGERGGCGNSGSVFN